LISALISTILSTVNEWLKELFSFAGHLRVKTGAAPGRAKSGSEEPGKSESPSTVNGLAGLVYAGYGAYIYTLILVIRASTPPLLLASFSPSARCALRLHWS
jgi:hypothetical protein